jgi:hypothetical protein
MMNTSEERRCSVDGLLIWPLERKDRRYDQVSNYYKGDRVEQLGVGLEYPTYPT